MAEVVYARRMPLAARFGMAAGAWIVVWIMTFFALPVGGAFVYSWGLCAGAAVLAFGAYMKRQGADETVKVKTWGQPMWLCIVSALLMLWATVGAVTKNPEGGIFFSNGYEPGIGTWVFCIVLMMVPLGFIAFRGSKGMTERERRRSTPEALALSRVTTGMLRAAGLTIKSEYTSEHRFPAIVGKGMTQDGDPYFCVRPVPGQTMKQFYDAAPRLGTAWGVRDVDIDEIDPANHIVQIVGFIRATGITEPQVWTPAPTNVPITEYVKRLPMGAYVQSGRPWHIDFSERNFAVSGLPGSGKSSFANAFLAHLARHQDVRLAFIDLKNGTEAAPWAPRLDAMVDNHDGDAGVQRAIDFIRLAIEDMRARYVRMREQGITNAWTEGFLGPNEPLKVLVLDECSELFKTGTKERAAMAEQVKEELKTFIQQGRAAGYVLIISTQYAREDSMPTVIREAVSDAMAFRVKARGVGAILGMDYYPPSALGDPTTIKAQGQAVVVGATDDGDRIQMPWIDRDAKLRVIQESAHLRRGWLDNPPQRPTERPTARSEQEAPPRPTARPEPPKPEARPQEPAEAASPASAEPEGVKEWNEPPRNPWL